MPFLSGCIFVMVAWNFAVSPHAAIYSMRDQRRSSQGNVHKRDRQQAYPCCGRPSSFLFSAGHGNGLYPHSIILFVDASDAQSFPRALGSSSFPILPLPCGQLDLPFAASQTRFMAHTYLLFDFGTDEEKAQLARHKLEGWKQAFRLDKKLLYKLDRGEPAADSAAPTAPTAPAEPEPKPAMASAKSSKSAKSAPKSKAKSKESPTTQEGPTDTPPANGKVSLVIRLYFSGHEKLTEQRWLNRIPAEEPFKDASPRLVHQGDAQFDELVQQFDSLQ